MIRTHNNTDMEELDKLQREYRNMEANRRAYADESAVALRKQQQTLDKLRKENECLKADLSLLQSRTTLKPINGNEQKEITRLIKDVEQYKSLIATEKSSISRAEEQAIKYREDIWRRRKVSGGSFASSESQRAVEKQVRMLLNKLDQALVKFNKSLAHNRNLRQDIDHLRGERVSFERVHSKLEKSLEERKKQMAQIIEQSNNAYEQRDKALAEISSITQTDKKEQEQFDQQMNELGDELETEIKLVNEKRKKNSSSLDINEEENKILAERKIPRACNALKDKDAVAMEQLKQTQKKFDDAFRKIFAATGQSDVDMIIESYTTNEKKNFSLLKYSSEQSDEIDKLNNEIKQIRDEDRVYASDCNFDSAKFDHMIREIDAKWQETQRQLHATDEKNSDLSCSIESLADGIKLLMARVNFNDEERHENESISECNVLQYLSMVEMKLNDLLTTYRTFGSVESNVDLTETDRVVSGPDAPMNADRNIYVNPPRFADYSSDENSGDDGGGNGLHPLTYEELKSKAMSRNFSQAQRRRSTRVGIPRRGSIRYSRDLSPSSGRRGTIMFDKVV